MLTQQQAQIFAQDEQTTTDNILKEHYQMYLLDQLFKSPFEGKLAFKGGTALKIVYNSARFSEDLDFSLLAKINYADFKKVIAGIPRIFPEAKVKDIYDKRFNLFARLVFTVDFKPIPIGIKIEVNKNSKDFKQAVALMKSPFNNIEVIGRVYTLEAILKDKMNILENNLRREPRDLFDAWYIHQKLNREFRIKKEYKYSHKELMNSLNAFLPGKYRQVIELFQK